jgi:hypothetical protein
VPFGAWGTTDEIAIQEELNTWKGVNRIIRHAFDLASVHTHPRQTRRNLDAQGSAAHHVRSSLDRPIDDGVGLVLRHRLALLSSFSF